MIFTKMNKKVEWLVDRWFMYGSNSCNDPSTLLVLKLFGRINLDSGLWPYESMHTSTCSCTDAGTHEQCASVPVIMYPTV